MKNRVALLGFMAVVCAQGAELTVQCKTWEGKVLVDIAANANSFNKRLKWSTFKKINGKSSFLKVTKAKISNPVAKDWATEKDESRGWMFLKSSDGGIAAQFTILQEKPKGDDDLDNGKGVTIEFPEFIQAYDVVGTTTVRYASLQTGIFIGELSGFDHGDDNYSRQDVVCKAKIE